MKKIAILILVTSSLIGDIPPAGRPNPGAFVDENKEVLENIYDQLKGIREEIRILINIQKEIKVPNFENEEFEKIRLEVQSINARLQYLIWLKDHPLEQGDY